MKKDVSIILSECIAALSGIESSGYWPFASPYPCSTEVAIKNNLVHAKSNLESALSLHRSMFGKGRSETEPPRVSIEKLK